MLAISTFTLTTLSIDEPAASSIRRRFSRIIRVSPMMVPRMSLPVAGSTAARPDTNRNGPPRTRVEAGWPSAAAASRPGGGATMARGSVMARFSSCGRDHVELDLEPGLALRGPHRAGRRAVGDVLAIDPVEHVA